MERILLVDDEPLVLAGIRMMIPWAEVDCEWVGNARNGEQALEMMETARPDIVIADINMPVMDGITLIRRAEERYPAAAFIMLTNLQEFSLVRDSLRHRAVDYLIKSQLDAEILRASILRAKAEARKRKDLRHLGETASARESDTLLQAKKGWQQLLMTRDMPAETVQACDALGIWAGYRLLEVAFRYPDRLLFGETGEEEIRQLGAWGSAIAREVAQRCFDNVLDIETVHQQHSVTLLLWGSAQGIGEEVIGVYARKLVAATGKIAGLSPFLLVSSPYVGQVQAQAVQADMDALRRRQYLRGEALLIGAGTAGAEAPSRLMLTGIESQLRTELTARNAPVVRQLMQRISASIARKEHDRAEALWLCNEIYTAMVDTLGGMEAARAALPDARTGYAQIRCLLTAEDVQDFLARLEGVVLSLLEDSATRQDIVIESVQQYVREHIHERITLQDAAQASCISAGYLSSMFKKQTGESFMGYVNRCKIERACMLIREGATRIGQIGWMLGYENAYYFTRVFKRYMGMTPSEYMEREQAQKP